MVVRIVAAEFEGQVDGVADAAEISVADADHPDEAVGRGIARANGEIARALFHHVHFQHDGVLLNAGIQLHSADSLLRNYAD